MITTQDFLLNRRVQIHQPAKGFRVAVDTVLLAAAVPAGPRDHVCELGAGVGAASLCLAARVAGCKITGLEIQPELHALAARNAESNTCQDRVQFWLGDVRRLPRDMRAGSFHHVFFNPPFYDARHAKPSPSLQVRQSKHAADGIAPWVKAARRLLRDRGWLTLIYANDGMPEILKACSDHGFGSLTVLPLWPKAGEPAKRCILWARAGGKSPFQLLSGLVLHEEDGRFTKKTEEILRDMAALTPADARKV